MAKDDDDQGPDGPTVQLGPKLNNRGRGMLGSDPSSLLRPLRLNRAAHVPRVTTVRFGGMTEEEEEELLSLVRGLLEKAGFENADEPKRGLLELKGKWGKVLVQVDGICSGQQQVIHPEVPLYPEVHIVDFESAKATVPSPEEYFVAGDLESEDEAARFVAHLHQLTFESVDHAKVEPVEPARPAEPLGIDPSDRGLRDGAGELRIPPSTQWHEVRFFYDSDNDTLSVSIEGHRTCFRVSYQDLGMANRRTRQPVQSWILLLTLCGRDEPPHAPAGRREFSSFKVRVSKLRKCLKAFFGIDGDPIRISRGDPVSTAFKVAKFAPAQRPRAIAEAERVANPRSRDRPRR